jgi:hydroxymethylpyrimidine pyrophosphatase-like HAD family hydrolase
MIVIHKEVETGLKKIYDLGRPVIINTLRFPLSVIRTFGKEWYSISRKPIPVVLLNGSQLGYIKQSGESFIFEQLASFPLEPVEIKEVISGLKDLQKGGVSDLVLFFYREDWKQGEIIWTPSEERIPGIRKKYQSASSVIACSVTALEKILSESPVCMILLLIEAKNDQLMAYQHTRRNNFITHKNVDKLYGTLQMAKHINFSLEDSLGAGDSHMDVFLNEAGLSVHVRTPDLPFTGKILTLKLQDYHAYGEILSKLSTMQKNQLISK